MKIGIEIPRPPLPQLFFNLLKKDVTKKIFAVSNAIRLNLPQAETTRDT